MSKLAITGSVSYFQSCCGLRSILKMKLCNKVTYTMRWKTRDSDPRPHFFQIFTLEMGVCSCFWPAKVHTYKICKLLLRIAFSGGLINLVAEEAVVVLPPL
ncbi:hypothetical protein M5689_006370 [Euphorbia peplus]|nr:hypothetical protein M5689_006370 [Euphorbia peplus]